MSTMNRHCAAASKAEFATWILNDDRILQEFCQELDLEETRLRQWVHRLKETHRPRVRGYNAALENSIQQLYAVFAGYAATMDLNSCACCIDAEDRRRLTAKPLYLLEGEDLAWYSHKAMTLWGDLAAFKYFLPRLLTLASQPDSGVFFPTLLDKFGHAGCRHWPRRERLALITYLREIWYEAMGRYPYAIAMNDLLRALVALGQDPRPLLDQWLQTVTPAAAQHLADLVMDHHIPADPLDSLEEDPAVERTARIVHDWLCGSEQPRRYLTQAFFLYASSDFSETIFEAEEILRRYYS